MFYFTYGNCLRPQNVILPTHSYRMHDSQSTHAGKIFQWHFVEYCIHHYCLLFLFIFVTVLLVLVFTCSFFVLASIASDPHSYFRVLCWNYCCVCFVYVLFCVLPHSYFPVASTLLLSCCCFLPTALLPLFYSVLNISNRYYFVYFFANIMIC